MRFEPDFLAADIASPRPHLYRYALKELRDPVAADDAVQETFAAALTGQCRFEAAAAADLADRHPRTDPTSTAAAPRAARRPASTRTATRPPSTSISSRPAPPARPPRPDTTRVRGRASASGRSSEHSGRCRRRWRAHSRCTRSTVATPGGVRAWDHRQPWGSSTARATAARRDRRRLARLPRRALGAAAAGD
jgi:hypothetical protein